MHGVIPGFQIADTWLKGLKVRSFLEQTTYAMNPLDAILSLSLPAGGGKWGGDREEATRSIWNVRMERFCSSNYMYELHQ